MAYPVPDTEPGRLEALKRLNILDTGSESHFDRIVEITKQAFDMPFSAISLLAEHREWFKATCGFGLEETSREVSFCAHVVAGNKLLVIEDARKDERFRETPLVTDAPNIRFYAGAPVTVDGGYCVGTLCVTDTEPRQFSKSDRTLLSSLAKVASDLMEARHKTHQVSYLTSALEQVDQPVFTIEGTPTDPSNASITWANRNYVKLVGGRRSELIGTTPPIFENLPDDPETERRVVQGLQAGEAVRGESTLEGKNGETYVASWILTPVCNEEGQITHWVSVQRDVTGQKRREARLEHEATHDSLSGLFNRAAIEEKVQEVLTHSRSGTLLYLDLDRFKRVNDTLGHSAGDKLLKKVATLLRENLREDATIARIGGDEFAIWLSALAGEDEATAIAERISQAFERPFSIQGEELYVGCSIGIIEDVAEYETAEAVFRDADVAMYEAKRTRGQSYIFHEPQMTEEMERRLRSDTVLRKAVDKDAFEPAFQPIVDLKDGSLVGLEVLARWRRQDGRLASPAAFLEIAEETGLIIPIGHQVIEKAFRAIQQVQRERDSALSLALSGNFSRQEFLEPETYDFISYLIQTYDFAPENFTMEVTERMVTNGTTVKQASVRRLKDLGVNLEIDDFGTGYSSLHSLLQLPADGFKIDKALIAEMSSNEEDTVEKAYHLVRSITELGCSLGLHVIAEGIETREQLSRLRQLDCSYGQGYLFSRPVSTCQLSDLVDSFPRSFPSS